MTKPPAKRKADWIMPSFGGGAPDDFFTSSVPKSRPVEVVDLTDDVDDSGCTSYTTDPWVTKYKPMFESDLAVHKKKVEDVKQCLQGFFRRNGQKNEAGIVLLTGPAGAGKTALVEVLARQMGCKLKEWINPVGCDYQEKSLGNWREHQAQQASQSEMFRDFLLRANRYTGLQMVGGDRDDGSKMIVLIEDLPNFVLHDPKKLHTMLRQYLSSGRNPVVFVLSDTHTADATVHSIFPKNIQLELHIKNISFNAVAATGLTKCMTKIVRDESKLNPDMEIPTKQVYDSIVSSCSGDVRSCINSLQFYCTKLTVPTDEKQRNGGHSENKKSVSKTKTIKTKTSKKKENGSKLSEEECPVFCGRDASLFLFRALGKILYCKRETTQNEVETALPHHLSHHTRMPLVADPEEVFDRTQISSDTFILYLHQNYTPFFASIEDLSDAAECLSDADLMMGAWTSRGVMSDYSSSVAMRGIMFNNQGVAGSTGSGGWRPLHKPQWFGTFKTRRENTQTGKELFFDTRHPSNVLHMDYLPYACLLNTKMRTTEHEKFARTVGRMERHRGAGHPGRQLQTITDGVHDVMGDEGEFTDFAARRRHLYGEEGEGVQEEVEVDDVIEDFDD